MTVSSRLALAAAWGCAAGWDNLQALHGYFLSVNQTSFRGGIKVRRSLVYRREIRIYRRTVVLVHDAALAFFLSLP
jgi:hypothetical protein